MRPFWQKPVFWITSFLVSMALLLLFTYLFKDSLLSLFPSNLTGRPQSPVQTSTPGPAVLDIKLTCPVPQEFCPKAKVMDDGENWRGLGFTLPQGTLILAVFAGRVENKPDFPDKPATQTLLYLRDNQGHEATYGFFGKLTVPIGAQVTAGMKIGTIDEGMFPSVAPFTGLNAVLTLKQNSRYVRIDPQDFVK